MIPRRAEVQREERLAWNDVLRARPDRDLPHRADRIGTRARDALYREHDLGRGREGIGPGGHDRGTSVIGTASDCHARVIDPDDVAHDTER